MLTWVRTGLYCQVILLVWPLRLCGKAHSDACVAMVAAAAAVEGAALGESWCRACNKPW